MAKSLRVHTVVVSGDLEKFKAAFSRSVLGVTFKKFKRKRSDFYQYRTHNNLVTQKIAESIYEHLLSERILKGVSLGDLELKTDYTIEWDANGKILSISDIVVSIFLKAGTLQVDRMGVVEKHDRIKIDLFYSDHAAGSKELRSILSSLISSIGSEKVDYNEFDFFTQEGQRYAEIYQVDIVPTVVIENKKLVNPPEEKIREVLEGLFVVEIKEEKPRMIIEEKAKKIINSFATAFAKP